MFVHATVDLDERAEVSAGCKIWHYSQIREFSRLGEGCIIGRNAYIGAGVVLGRNCKVQNHALVYEPAVLEDGVFIGPAAVLTNDEFPRAVNPDLTIKSAEEWKPVGVTVREGASVGARAVCVAPLVIGRWSTVAAGAVVTRDVPDFALVAGVPARRIGWMGRQGHRLVQTETGKFRCPVDGSLYEEVGTDMLKEIEAR